MHICVHIDDLLRLAFLDQAMRLCDIGNPELCLSAQHSRGKPRREIRQDFEEQKGGDRVFTHISLSIGSLSE